MIERLFREQMRDWALAAKNYSGLQEVIWKTIPFNGFEIRLQYNPERILSSTAKTDAESLARRPCFFCHRPPEQRGIAYPPRYDLLINPYPILPLHLTVPDTQHVPQRIAGRMIDMLNLAEYLTDFTILYNGPESGASAPDHFHFQAIRQNLLPVEKEIHSFGGKRLLREVPKGKIFHLDNYLRSCFVYESADKEWLSDQFEAFVEYFHTLQPEDDEPRFNLIARKERMNWQLFLFPRTNHHPRQYYATGEEQILVAPGVVDFGGILVAPRKEDFEKLDKNLIADIFAQLTISDETTRNICRHLVG